MDSVGIIRMFNRKFGPNWIQVANTKSHVSFSQNEQIFFNTQNLLPIILQRSITNVFSTLIMLKSFYYRILKGHQF